MKRFLYVLLLLVAPPALAQMPDLRSMSGRPLPVADLPAGTVTIRVVRQSPANPVSDVEVTSTSHSANGDARSRAAKTGADGRVTFEGVPTGGDFQASVTVDGERLETARFPVPRSGGIRVMLIAGLGAAPPGGQSAPPGHGGVGEGPPTFRMGAATGTVAPAADLPVGTLELELRDGSGRPLPGKAVQVAEVHLKPGPAGAEGNREVGVHRGTSDAAGKVRFEKLTVGEAAGYAAVTEHEGLRLGTQPFRMPTDTGLRGTIVALRRTSDTSALRIDPRSKVVIYLREDAIAVMVALIVRNTSQEIFDGGEEGLIVPLPSGAVGAQELEGGDSLDIAPGQAVRLKHPIPPDSAANFASQIRFGYVLPADGEPTIEVKQVFPIAMPEPFILMPAKDNLELSGPGVTRLKDETDSHGDKVLAYTAPPVAASGTMTLQVSGIPARSRGGRNVAAALSLLLLLGAAVFAGPRGGDKAASERESLAQRREKLFQELVALEQQRQADPAAKAASNGRLADRRKELVTTLETIYRDLAKLESSAGV
jgi:hypothetical protein